MARIETGRGLSELRMMFRDEMPVYGKRVLDIGCGQGRAVLQAEKEGAKRAVGVDVDLSMLRSQWGANFTDLFSKLSWKESLRSEVIRVKSCRNLPLKDASFDIVICSFVLPYVSDKLGLLREAVRLTAPGGRIYLINVGGYSSYTSLHRAWSNGFLLADERCKKRLGRLKGIIEERELTYSKWRKETDPDAAAFGEIIDESISIPSDEKEFRINDMKVMLSNFYVLFGRLIGKSDKLAMRQSGIGMIIEKSEKFEEKDYKRFASSAENASKYLMMNINLGKQDDLRSLPTILSVFDKKVL